MPLYEPLREAFKDLNNTILTNRALRMQEDLKQQEIAGNIKLQEAKQSTAEAIAQRQAKAREVLGKGLQKLSIDPVLQRQNRLSEIDSQVPTIVTDLKKLGDNYRNTPRRAELNTMLSELSQERQIISDQLADPLEIARAYNTQATAAQEMMLEAGQYDPTMMKELQPLVANKMAQAKTYADEADYRLKKDVEYRKIKIAEYGQQLEEQSLNLKERLGWDEDQRQRWIADQLNKTNILIAQMRLKESKGTMFKMAMKVDKDTNTLVDTRLVEVAKTEGGVSYSPKEVDAKLEGYIWDDQFDAVHVKNRAAGENVFKALGQVKTLINPDAGALGKIMSPDEGSLFKKISIDVAKYANDNPGMFTAEASAAASASIIAEGYIKMHNEFVTRLGNIDLVKNKKTRDSLYETYKKESMDALGYVPVTSVGSQEVTK